MDKASISRYVILIVAVINSVLNMIGYETISDDLTNHIVSLLSGVYILCAAWKDNDLTKKAVNRKKLIKDLEK